MNTIKNAKSALRKEMKQKLNLLTSEEKSRQSEVVKNKLFSMPQYQNCKRISIFLNMSDEIQTLGILKDAFKMNKICFIPRYDSSSNHMDMVRINSWQDFESLPETKWKIKQPLFEDKRETALSSGGLDLILVPGLAFTKCGKRLGRGRGYYDTYLNRCLKGQDQPPLTVALTFKEQIVPDIPTDDTDVTVNTILHD
ncbi:5-formyltetrahydrofolate cyclo-ligase, partial [Armadillidium vulgare]